MKRGRAEYSPRPRLLRLGRERSCRAPSPQSRAPQLAQNRHQARRASVLGTVMPLFRCLPVYIRLAFPRIPHTRPIGRVRVLEIPRDCRRAPDGVAAQPRTWKVADLGAPELRLPQFVVGVVEIAPGRPPELL